MNVTVWRGERTARILIEGTETGEQLDAYYEHGGFASRSWSMSPESLLQELELSGLRGRGGSAFPTAIKWRSVAARPGNHVVLVNGAETEPASQKDRALMLKRPFLVLEGALLAARAIGAREVVWYASQDVLSSVRAAIAVAQQQVPSNVLGGVRWVVVPAANAYVAGEETAAIQAVNGKVAKPSVKPPLPFERGVHGLPTLIQNVETLAHVPFIMRAGATAFRAAGLESSPGTMLVTLSGEVRRPGVYEAPTGARLNDIIEEFGGGVRDGSPLQAVLPGGYFSGWLSGAAVAGGVTLDRQTLQQHGAAIGSGAIAVVSGATCGLAQAVAVLKFFARESARQCGPCTFGTQAMADALQRVASGTPNETDLPKLRQWSEVMLPRRGACGHLDGASMAARTALHVFDKEIRQHARFGRCGRAARVVLEGLGSAGDHRAA